MPAKRLVVAALVAPTIAMILAVQPVQAACQQVNIYGANTGSVRVAGSTTADGVAATVDLVSVTVPLNKAVVHPMQWQSSSIMGDWLGYGTYNGLGTDEGLVYNCASDYIGWNVYLDGTENGEYFCRRLGVELGMTATENRFKMRYGLAGFCLSIRFTIFLNGSPIACQAINQNYPSGTVAAGGEVVSTTSLLQNKVRYYGVEKHNNANDVWSSWSQGESLCESGYKVTLAASDDFAPELQ